MTTHGFTKGKFDSLRATFDGNLASGADIGASVSVRVSDETVVDLWGGWTSTARVARWQPDTLVNFFSVGKGMLALLAARFAGTGLIDPDAPVASYWPEFGAAGKAAVTVRQLLRHQAGVPAVRRRLPPDAMLDWDLMTAAIAAQDPWWEPGTAHGYHVNTFGYLVGETIRRVTGKTLGTILREEIAAPLDADVHISLPESEHARVAEFLFPEGMPSPPADTSDELQRMRWNTYWNPPGFSGRGWVNRPEWRMAEIPSTNGHGNARGIAKVPPLHASAARAPPTTSKEARTATRRPRGCFIEPASPAKAVPRARAPEPGRAPRDRATGPRLPCRGSRSSATDRWASHQAWKCKFGHT